PVTASAESSPVGIRRFRSRLGLAMMAVVVVVTASSIYFAQRRADEDAQIDLQGDFELELAALHRLQDLRNAAVADRSKDLARNPRIHAALEDNALDLLYPSAQDELRGFMAEPGTVSVSAAAGLHAQFYRFLDAQGAVLVPPTSEAGALSPNEQRLLSRPKVPQTMQIGYLTLTESSGQRSVREIIALPIRSNETGEVLGALVLGFKPVETTSRGTNTGMRNGILVNGELQLPDFDQAAEEQAAGAVTQSLTRAGEREHSLRTTIAKVPHLLFYKRLNPDSNYPPAYEVCVYPLTQLQARERKLRAQILGAGGLFLLGGFVLSQFLS